AQNSSLRQRVQRASRRATAINERYLRRIGADLHDGPAQLVALAALRMDSPALVDPGTSSTLREAEIAGIHKTLGEAMRE
ncbi:sensor histidine kinase, partial [Mesorhizobium sp. M2D.F.Ca.ET.140.01.1.1]